MELDAGALRPSLMYQHLIRLIVPRPIAWVSTVSLDGVANIAPFSFFSGVGSRPPSVVFCPANKRDGTPKDTLRNIRETGEFVINVVTAETAAVMNLTSAELPPDESEFHRFEVGTVPSTTVRPPRVAASPVQLECTLMQAICLDEGPGGANLVIGRITWMHLDDGVLDESGLVDPIRLNAVGRMGGTGYCRTQDTFDLPRP